MIRESKFYKSRPVPFGPKIGALLSGYLEVRVAQDGALPPAAPLFTFGQGRFIHPGSVSQRFHKLLPQLQIELPVGTWAPRLHDLRHSFAVGRLLRWYRSGLNPTVRLLQLSTFLGHVDPSSTAVYLTITSALLDEANRRFEAFAAPALSVEAT